MLDDVTEKINTSVETLVAELVTEATATKRQQFSGEDFDGWLPLTINNDVFYNITLSQLKSVRDVSRNLAMTSEIFKNVLKHYRNKIVGSGLTISLYPEDMGDDPVKLAANKGDATIAQMLLNWKLFCKYNKFDAKARNWVWRLKRDGEVFLRLFPGSGEIPPALRFVDPSVVESDKPEAEWGIGFDGGDMETPKTFYIKDLETNKYASVKAELIIHHKDSECDSDFPRGLPSVYPVAPNIRRVDKLLINIGAVAQIQSAIALIRKHKGTNQANVKSFLNKNATSTRTNVAGSSVRTKMYDPGTILDAPDTVEYDFPAHSIDVKSFAEVLSVDLARVANNFVVPLEWLLGEEPSDPLNGGSPVVANFLAEQDDFYGNVEELFWRVQTLMGIDREANEPLYKVVIEGPRLSVAKALDEARMDEIYQRLGAISPQEIASKIGNNWTLSRANTIKHRNTAQPGEQMPGDSGNTNTGGGDGTSLAGGGQKKADGSGGNNAT